MRITARCDPNPDFGQYRPPGPDLNEEARDLTHAVMKRGEETKMRKTKRGGQTDTPPDRIRLWALAASKEERVRFVVRLAQRALLRERRSGREPDPRSWAAVRIGRRLFSKRTSDEEIRAAERDAAWAAFEARWVGLEVRSTAAQVAAHVIPVEWELGFVVSAARYAVAAAGNEKREWQRILVDAEKARG